MDWKTQGALWLAQEHMLTAALAPVLEATLARAGVHEGMDVLDIGCGTGDSLLRLAASVGEAGHVTGADVAAPMVERARARTAASGRVDVLLTDAQTHGFAPQRFDAAVSVFGSMFFDDTVAAFGNLRAALKPGARFTLSAWGDRKQNPWFTGSGHIAMAKLGKMPPPEPDAPGPFRFADPAVALDALAASGWSNGAAETVAVTLTPVGTPAEIAANQMVVGGASAVINALGATEAQRAELLAEITDWFAARDTPDGVQVPAVINIVTACA
ncbi:MAG: class I SAM-dependent methyltransferase [Rhodobacteraceae bacterium]|nr:class I SAM-dependent methyltransferase [Paracoccaceae bacterium]